MCWETLLSLIYIFSSVLVHGDLVTDSNMSLKIVGGQEVVPHSYPYQVGIAIREPRTGWCGGALISNEFVLTAVHCLKGIRLATLYIGAHDVHNLSSSAMKIDITPRNMHLHRLWTPRNAINDIALIQLPSPIPFSDSIQPIALPTTSKQTTNWISPGKMLVTTGWGRTTRNTTLARPSRLHSVKLRVEEDATCKNLFVRFEPMLNICLEGNGDKSSCYGDSGGPVVATNMETGMHVLVGIISYGRKCESVTVLTKVAAYLDWIGLTMGTLGRCE